MSRAVFVDASAWYALADDHDNAHTPAIRRMGRLLRNGRTLVTTSYVVGETYTLVRRRLGHRAAQAFLQRIRGTSYLKRVQVPEAWEEAAEELLARYDDQPFSYVDATSFITMRRLGIQEAFAFDRDFLIAGFNLVGDD